ncbi:uncharacterized protein LOC130222661 [Danio aesculapii]|uniref:uncharacterized protein LOC130222661 n=1 Tax=Danio aesculapii TaxID=1142201 RepID=UPI0024C0D4D9|nr:uncharacterized protein LOC130222661 [Danio aesculapii]
MAFIKEESEDVKIEETFTVKHEDPEEQAERSSKTVRMSKRSFLVPQGLDVCFLTDSMCLGIEEFFPNAHCWVHPAASLLQSAHTHVKPFVKLLRPTVVVLHMGTHDISCRALSLSVVHRVKALTAQISRANPQVLFFVISAILPRLRDDCFTKATVKQTNRMVYRWTKHPLPQHLQKLPQIQMHRPKPV